MDRSIHFALLLAAMFVSFTTAAFGQLALCDYPPVYNGGCVGVPDSSFASQWNVEAVRACEVWSLGYTGTGMVVGIVDWGILQDDVTGGVGHPDLNGQVDSVAAGCSEARPNFDPNWQCFEDGHGTQMAGVVAAILGNDTSPMPRNIVGIAYGAKLAEIFLYDDSGGPPITDTEVEQVILFKNDCSDVKVNAYDITGENPVYERLPVLIRDAL